MGRENIPTIRELQINEGVSVRDIIQIVVAHLMTIPVDVEAVEGNEVTHPLAIEQITIRVESEGRALRNHGDRVRLIKID
jgi:hypothetical protein